MKIKLHSLSFAATVAVLVTFAFGSNLLAQSNSDPASPQTQQQAAPPAQQSPDAQEPASQQPGQGSPDQAQPNPASPQAQPTDSRGSEELVGTILKKGDKYVFQDAASGNTYDIDHQDEVKKFEGKKVRVHGTVDPKSNTIHVQ